MVPVCGGVFDVQATKAQIACKRIFRMPVEFLLERNMKVLLERFCGKAVLIFVLIICWLYQCDERPLHPVSSIVGRDWVR